MNWFYDIEEIYPSSKIRHRELEFVEQKEENYFRFLDSDGDDLFFFIKFELEDINHEKKNNNFDEFLADVKENDQEYTAVFRGTFRKK